MLDAHNCAIDAWRYCLRQQCQITIVNYKTKQIVTSRQACSNKNNLHTEKNNDISTLNTAIKKVESNASLHTQKK